MAVREGATDEARRRIGAIVWSRLLLFVLPTALVIFLFVRPIFHDENFVYRDAGHFYYPYFEIQIDQWMQGRVPQWNPYENGGEPLAANPTASVFYPLKLLFFLPFPLAYKWYLMGHGILCGVTCYVAARGLATSREGALLAALSYALSGFVLFQLYNIVFLVGAAWLPLGLLATDRLVRTPSLAWVIALAIVLAMQVLGGDPQVAQLTGVFAIAYALFHWLGFAHGLLAGLVLLALGAAWIHCIPPISIISQGILASIHDPNAAPLALHEADSWLRQNTWPFGIAATLAIVALCVFRLSWRRWNRPTLRSSVAALLFASALGTALAAVQVLPTMEFASRTSRASPDVPEETAAFSLHPARVAELVAPSVYGRLFPQNSRWFPFASIERAVWTPTIYMGLIPFALAIGAVTLRATGHPRTWLTWLAIASLAMAFGKFGGLAWIWNVNQFGATDPLTVEPGSRLHGYNDGLYWIAEQTIPGFAMFRYPAKLFVFTTCASALLAGIGLDRWILNPRILHALGWIGSGFFGAIALTVYLAKTSVLATIESFAKASTTYGPFQPTMAWYYLVESFSHVAIVALIASIGLAISLSSPRFARALPAWLLLVIGLDLAVANRWLVLTDKQSAIDEPSRVLKAITNDAFKKEIAEPFRIHRTRMFEPPRFAYTTDPQRVKESIRWERATAQPKYAIADGFSYAKTEGTMTLFDIDFFFAPWDVKTPTQLRKPGASTPERMVYYPKNGLDIWNTRYFILPRLLQLDDVDRGTFTLLFDRTGKPLPVIAESKPDQDDFLVLENTEALPRAWIVRDIEVLPPIRDMRRATRAERMERLLYRSRDAGLFLWEGRPHGDYPYRQRAMVEAPDGQSHELKSIRPAPTNPESDDQVIIEVYEPDYVRMRINSEGPGLCILADTDYPGWSVFVDAAPSRIYRTNGAMRGVLVPAGNHLLEFRFRSQTLLMGGWISAMAWAIAILAVLLRVLFRIRPDTIGQRNSADSG